MTKPRNFPGRKQERRISALERIIAFGGVKSKAKEKEIEILKERISKGGKRNTKKNKSL